MRTIPPFAPELGRARRSPARRSGFARWIEEVDHLDDVHGLLAGIFGGPDNQNTPRRIVVIRQAQLDVQTRRLQFFGERTQPGPGRDDGGEIDILGAARVSVHCQHGGPDQCGADAQTFSRLGDPLSQRQGSLGIEHLA